jgi:hypothetical protein
LASRKIRITILLETCINSIFEVKLKKNAGAKMGIHYDYKSTRNEKAMKKEAKRKARIEEKKARKGNDPQNNDEKIMHDIDKPITLEDLTNPDKD